VSFRDELCFRLSIGTVDGFVEQLDRELKATPRWRFIRRFHVEHQLLWARAIAKAYAERVGTVIDIIALAKGAPPF